METSPPWRVLEFYSGIGGMRYSLTASGVRAEVVEAFDINDVANGVYELNFGHLPCQGNIQTLTASDLDKYKAHAWLLSPPCQPYTRQGLQKHSADARAFSFIKILNQLAGDIHLEDTLACLLMADRFVMVMLIRTIFTSRCSFIGFGDLNSIH